MKFQRIIILGTALSLIVAAQLTSTVSFSAETGSIPAPKQWSFNTIHEVPIQSGGRLKPLDSFGREVLLFETGSRSFQSWDAADFLLSVLAFPESWLNVEFIQVSREDVRRQLGLDLKKTRFAPRELMANVALAQYAQGMDGQQVSAPIAKTAKADPREQELKRVIEKLTAFHRMISGEAWTLIPHASGNWKSIAENGPEGTEIRNSMARLVHAYQAEDRPQFELASQVLLDQIHKSAPQWSDSMASRIHVESLYNRYRPFLWSWAIYVLGALVWLLAFRWNLKSVALSLTGIAFLIQLAGILMRCFVAGRPPVTNMYESIIWVSFGQAVFAGILYLIHRQGILFLVSCVLAAAGLIAADAAPAMMDPGLHPLVPVLRSNYWLTIHVLTITLGYAALALTLGLGNVSLYYFTQADRAGVKVKIASINQLIYRAMQFGVVLLAAGTILGGIWADYSWGRFWGWDPKEVWALIALLCYLTILHARFTGWVGQFGFAAWSVVSFLSVVMAWYGVNFVLGVGLHSYGFASGGMSSVAIFVGLQLAYVAWVGWKYKLASLLK